MVSRSLCCEITSVALPVLLRQHSPLEVILFPGNYLQMFGVGSFRGRVISSGDKPTAAPQMVSEEGIDNG
jgi:hypothetical protein